MPDGVPIRTSDGPISCDGELEVIDLESGEISTGGYIVNDATLDMYVNERNSIYTYYSVNSETLLISGKRSLFTPSYLLNQLANPFAAVRINKEFKFNAKIEPPETFQAALFLYLAMLFVELVR